MALTVTPAIPASQLVDIIPSVLNAGGAGLDLISMFLTQSPKVPIGTVAAFSSAADVGNFFGALSQEAALATIYFLGPNNATIQPASLDFIQYPEQAVAGWLRSGSFAGVSLATLQAINASLTISIDGTPATQAINLSTATSFSNAAVLLATQMGIRGVQKANLTASLSGSVMTVATANYGPQQALVTASLSGTTMTVTGVTSGSLAVGQVVVGTGISAGVTISAFGTGTGGVGTYTLSTSVTTESAETITAYSPTVALSVGDVVSGTGITNGTYIASFGTGTGGAGTYNLSAAATTESNETVLAYASAVQYDATQQAFYWYSGTTGASSAVSFGTGAAAAPLKLTSALGAVVSPGAAAATPGAFMQHIVDAITTNWATFLTLWEPIPDDKVAFAAWVSGTGSRYAYLMADTSAADTQVGGPSAPVASITAAAYTGVVMIYEDPAVDSVGQEITALAASWAASLDFTRKNGRQTMAYKSQAGLAAQVFTGTAATYLTGYGLNFYGDYTTANQAFIMLQPGQITGPFLWFDSYVNQIWLTNELQLAAMELLTQVGSIPYNQEGYNLIAAAFQDPINAAVNFGAIVAGVVLSNAQIAEVNAMAGLPIDAILVQRGWYLQVNPATAQTRAARGSPPCTLFYCDGGSIQKIVLAAIEVQ